MLLFYVRHADPIYSPDSLTSLGKRQAESVAKRLALYGIDRIFSSTSNRAIETAIPTSELVKKEIELLDFCNESYAWKDFSVPDNNGGRCWVFQKKEMNNLFVSEDIRKLSNKWYDHTALSGFNFKKGVERVNRDVDKWLATLGYEHNRKKGVYNSVKPNDNRIALFAHQGFGFAFLSAVLDVPYYQIVTHFDMTHTGITVIEFDEADGIVIPKVLTLSNDSHLYKDGLPTCYKNYIFF